MELGIVIKMNSKLYVRNPEESKLGKKIVCQGVILINKYGFEDFTFKKLANEIKTTEAGIYRYFENKHRLLVYILTWYWAYIEYQVVFQTNNIKNPGIKLKTIIRLLVVRPAKTVAEDDFVPLYEAYNVVLWEASKAYLTHKVNLDNKNRLFKPYKDLCGRIALLIKEFNPQYKFPNSLASTIVEMSHSQKFFMHNLPALTDFTSKDDAKLILFLEGLVFSS